MAKLSKKQIAAVKAIAVNYWAWSEARDKAINNQDGWFRNKESINSLRVWARMLKENQEVLGVDVVSVDLLDANVEGYLYSYIDSETGMAEYTNNSKIALGY